MPNLTLIANFTAATVFDAVSSLTSWAWHINIYIFHIFVMGTMKKKQKKKLFGQVEIWTPDMNGPTVKICIVVPCDISANYNLEQ